VSCNATNVHTLTGKYTTLFLPLTLPRANRLSKFFHRQT